VVPVQTNSVASCRARTGPDLLSTVNMAVVPHVPVRAWLADRVRTVVRISQTANALHPFGSENSLVSGSNDPGTQAVEF